MQPLLVTNKASVFITSGFCVAPSGGTGPFSCMPDACFPTFCVSSAALAPSILSTCCLACKGVQNHGQRPQVLRITFRFIIISLFSLNIIYFTRHISYVMLLSYAKQSHALWTPYKTLSNWRPSVLCFSPHCNYHVEPLILFVYLSFQNGVNPKNVLS